MRNFSWIVRLRTKIPGRQGWELSIIFPYNCIQKGREVPPERAVFMIRFRVGISGRYSPLSHFIGLANQ